MKFVKGALVATALVSGLGLAERTTDPFDRYEQNYTLEGPQRYSEIPYFSSNWHESDGTKHDDRIGDILLGLSVLAGVARVIVALNEFEAGNKKIPIARDHSVT